MIEVRNESTEADGLKYVLNGTVELLIGNTVKSADKGDSVVVPAGDPHARRNTSDEGRLSYPRTPAGFECLLALRGEGTEPPSRREQFTTFFCRKLFIA